MANSGHYPVDPTTLVGQIRTLIGDTEPTGITGTPPTQLAEYLWNSDAELEGLLTVFNQSAGGVAVHVLRLVSMSQAMLLKKFTSADLSVDGPAITRALNETIAAIEKGMAAGDDLLTSQYANLVDTGRVHSHLTDSGVHGHDYERYPHPWMV